MTIEERKLYSRVYWVGQGQDGVATAMPDGHGAMVFTAPAADHIYLVLIVENPRDSGRMRDLLPGIINYLALNIFQQGGVPDNMLWYSCIDGRFDRLVPRWFGLSSNGTPMSPQVQAYPCGNRSFESFRDICKIFAIDTVLLLEQARRFEVPLKD